MLALSVLTDIQRRCADATDRGCPCRLRFSGGLQLKFRRRLLRACVQHDRAAGWLACRLLRRFGAALQLTGALIDG
jgi:hypothetical protein